MNYEDLADELLRTKKRMFRAAVDQKIEDAIRGESFVLEYLLHHDNVAHPKELSKAMSVSTARIARLLNHMEEREFIARRSDSHDSRQIIVELTKSGQERGRKKWKEAIEATVEMLRCLEPEEAVEYIRIQNKIADHFIPSDNHCTSKAETESL